MLRGSHETMGTLVHGLDQPSPADIAESFHDVGAQRSAAAPVRLPPVRELVWVPHDWIRCVGSCGELSASSVAHQVVALVCVQPRPTAQRAQRVHHGPRVTRRARLAQLPPVGGVGVQHTVRPVATQAPCSHHHHGFEGVRTGTWWPPSTPRGLAAPCAIGAARGCTLPPPPAPS